MIHRFLIIIFIILGFGVLYGCGGNGDGDETTTETTTEPAACETNNTAEVYFVNDSNTNTTYDIIWDGVKITTVSPGNKSGTFTVAAGVEHTLVFRISNTNDDACTPSTPIPPQCETWWYNCTG